MRKLTTVLICLMVVVSAFADQKKAAQKLSEAERAYSAGNLPRAEKAVRDALKEDPTSAQAHALLGDVLMVTKRFSQAAEEYTAALQADEKQNLFNPAQRRSLKNQQGAAYGMGGNLDRAHEIFTQAVKEDPDYPLFWYNLGAVYAEKNQLEPALENLREAWKRRDKMPAGQAFPDPRKDPSFANHVNDPRFQDAVRDMVF